MTNPMNPNSRTIEAADPTKVRGFDCLRPEQARSLGYHYGLLDGTIGPCDIRNSEFLAGYFYGCDERRGIVR